MGNWLTLRTGSDNRKGYAKVPAVLFWNGNVRPESSVPVQSRLFPRYLTEEQAQRKATRTGRTNGVRTLQTVSEVRKIASTEKKAQAHRYKVIT
jgi:hypothetical protein